MWYPKIKGDSHTNKYKMNIDSKTFCILPFIHKHQRLSGVETLCCHSQHPIDRNNKQSIINLQKQLTNDEKIPHCIQCWNTESKNLESSRQRENKLWLSKPDIVEYIKNHNIGDDETTFSYDLRYSNICNLACIGCMPQQSSLWAKELNVQTLNIKNNFDIGDIKKSKSIYLAGGEPFLVPEMIELLKQIAKQAEQPSICINTNLTVQDDELKSICKDLKSLTLTISIDGINKIAEYHRYPLRWDKFERNLEWTKQLNCSLMFNTLVDAVNVSFIHEIMKYESYVDVWGFILLDRPVPLQLNNLPEHLKKSAHYNFLNLKESIHYNNETFKNTIETISEKILMPGEPQLLSNHIKTLDNRRNINHVNYLGISLI